MKIKVQIFCEGRVFVTTQELSEGVSFTEAVSEFRQVIDKVTSMSLGIDPECTEYIVMFKEAIQKSIFVISKVPDNE